MKKSTCRCVLKRIPFDIPPYRYTWVDSFSYAYSPQSSASAHAYYTVCRWRTQVFFYIDPAVLDDPALAGMRSLTLSYTFFRTTDPEAEGISSFLGHGSSSAPAAAGVAGEQQRTAATATVASDDTDALRTQIAQWTQKTASSIGSDGSSSPK